MRDPFSLPERERVQRDRLAEAFMNEAGKMKASRCFIPVCIVCGSMEPVACITTKSERREIGDLLCEQHIESGDVTLPKREEKA